MQVVVLCQGLTVLADWTMYLLLESFRLPDSVASASALRLKFRPGSVIIIVIRCTVRVSYHLAL